MSTDNHTLFQGHLKESAGAVWLVARWLQERGNAVTVNPTSVAARHDEWRNHADSGDLYISQRIEVKALSADFTSRYTWPYKDRFIVCAKHAWDRAVPKPFAFIHLNKAKTHAAVVSGSTHKEWFVERRSDGRYQGVAQECYFCPLESVQFVELRTAALT